MLLKALLVRKVCLVLLGYMCQAEQLQRIRKIKPQFILEAKVGPYKLFDKSFQSLILKNAWVSDEVSKFNNKVMHVFLF